MVKTHILKDKIGIKMEEKLKEKNEEFISCANSYDTGLKSKK
jgi:hypothetical protein